MKHTVIRVVRNEIGQDCKTELTFDYKIDADYWAERLNAIYGSKKLNWIVDSYKIASIQAVFFIFFKICGYYLEITEYYLYVAKTTRRLLGKRGYIKFFW